jgi:hypothetical protein
MSWIFDLMRTSTSKTEPQNSPPLSLYTYVYIGKGKGKAVPLQEWNGPEGSRKLRFPDFLTTAQYGGKIVSLTHRPPLPQEIVLVLISAGG